MQNLDSAFNKDYLEICNKKALRIHNYLLTTWKCYTSEHFAIKLFFLKANFDILVAMKRWVSRLS